MTPRRETCRWVKVVVSDLESHFVTGCLRRADHDEYTGIQFPGYFLFDQATYCPHCGGRIVRDQPKEGV